MTGAEMTFWAVLATVVAGLVYAGHCWIFPYASCRKCEGDGRFRSGSGRAWRDCRRCKGSGKRVRIGRRLWTWLAARKHNAVG
jgi:hypothetical protein